MEQHHFRYQILRYVPDLRRMEPENIGIIVQGSSGAACQFLRIGRRADFDRDNFRAWKHFFEVEILGNEVPLFQPKRNSIEFLNYLRSRCQGNYSLTEPLALVMEVEDLLQVRRYLFETLIAVPEEKPVRERKPVQRFKSELRTRKVLSSPYLKQKHVFELDGQKQLVAYQYTRNHGANLPVVIQPVPWSLDIAATDGDLERVGAIVNMTRHLGAQVEIHVVMDEVQPPINRESDAKKYLYDKYQLTKAILKRGRSDVVESTEGAVALADLVTRDIEDLEEAGKTASLFV